MQFGGGVLITFERVSGARGGRLLFTDICFAVASGGALVISGANGVGKSSLIRIAAGLLRPLSGTVAGAAKRGLMAEAAALDSEATLADALGFWARIDRVPEVEAGVASALAMLDLAYAARIPVRLLSTGQRRRAALAPLMVANAPVWLLDEPASGLDSAAITRLELIIADHRARGGAVIVATHQPLTLPGAAILSLSDTGARGPQ